MKRSLRRITVGALFALAVVPGSASAAVNGTISQSTVAAGCQPKGLIAFGANATAAPGLAAGVYQYTVVALTGGTPAAPTTPGTPCIVQPVPLAGTATSNATFMQWNATPGATAYKIYRNGEALIFAAGPPLVKTLAPSQVCPPGGTGTGPRCAFRDNGGPTDASDTAPAGPAALTQAGSHPDLRIVQTVDYSGDGDSSNDPYQGNVNAASPDALKDNLLHFPPGLLANPTATSATCKLSGAAPSLLGDLDKHGSSDPDEDTCPRASQVGTVAVVAKVGPDPGRLTVIPGDIYIGEKLPPPSVGAPPDDATARLYVALRPACSAGSFIAPGSAACVATLGSAAVEVEKSFLSAKATIRAGDYGIDNETTSIGDGTDQDLASTSNIRVSTTGAPAGTTRLQVQSLAQTLFGLADQGTAAGGDDSPFVYLPTSCAAKTLSADLGTYGPAPNTRTVTTPLQATRCDLVDFSPVITAELDTSGGETGQNAHPSFIADIVQSDDEAATKTAQVTLPEGLGTDTTALAKACTVAQQATGCPASSQVGTASATTPVLPGTLAGPVYLAEVPGALPKLIVQLTGAASITFEGAISFNSTNTRLVNTFNNLPEVTLSSFQLGLTGGAGGLLQLTRDVCDEPLGNLDAAFNGHNDKIVTSSPTVAQGGEYYCVPEPTYPCKPAKPKLEKLSIKGVAKAKAKVKMKARRNGKCAEGNLKVTRLRLPKGINVVPDKKNKVKIRANGKKIKNFKANGRTIKFETKNNTTNVEIKTEEGALRVKDKVADKGTSKKLKFKTKIKVRSGKKYKYEKKVKPKS